MSKPKIRPIYTLGVPYCTPSCPSLVIGEGCRHLRPLERGQEVCVPDIRRMVTKLGEVQTPQTPLSEARKVLQGVAEGYTCATTMSPDLDIATEAANEGVLALLVHMGLLRDDT